MTDHYQNLHNVINNKINQIYIDCKNAVDVRDFNMIILKLESLSYLISINTFYKLYVSDSRWINCSIHAQDIDDLWNIIDKKIAEFNN